MKKAAKKKKPPARTVRKKAAPRTTKKAPAIRKAPSRREWLKVTPAPAPASTLATEVEEMQDSFTDLLIGLNVLTARMTRVEKHLKLGKHKA